MALPSQVRILLKGVQQGDDVEQQLDWYRTATAPNPTSQAAAEEFYATQWPAIQALLTTDYRLMEIQAQVFQVSPAVSSPLFVLTVNEGGGIDDEDAMPAFNVVNVTKIPDQATADPEDRPEFGVGRVGFSGFSEAQQVNGYLTSAALTSWNAVGELLEELEFEGGAGVLTWTLGMWRPAYLEAPNPTRVLVSETYAKQRVGRQGSRGKP